MVIILDGGETPTLCLGNKYHFPIASIGSRFTYLVYTLGFIIAHKKENPTALQYILPIYRPHKMKTIRVCVATIFDLVTLVHSFIGPVTRHLTWNAMTS